MSKGSTTAPRDAHYLVWVYPVPLATALDSATWLQTTQALRNLGWQVTLIGKGPTGEQVINGVTVTCLATVERYLLNNLLFHLRVLWLLWRKRRTVDVVLFHQLSALWLLPLRLLRGFSRRPSLVMDTRDLNVVEGGLKNRLRRAYFTGTHHLANHWADGQTAITPRMADLVQIPPAQRWGYWPSGVDLARFARCADRRRWPNADEPIQLIYVGKLHAERNLLPLCLAVVQAHRQGLNVCFTLVGSGPAAARIAAVAATSEGRIRLLPAVPHEQIPALLCAAHVGVTSLPAPADRKYAASSPIKLFEYMAAGLTVLATNNVCHSEVVQQGQYAFWARGTDPDTLLQTLVAIDAARANLPLLGKLARQAVEPWTWRSAAAQLDQALKVGMQQTIV